ncbi:MAG TPA: hypothetical protein VNI83_05520 [Vicinamibacterales bacterium]|nr:hypothetical protein [Vicinamibacterales bacterium]
MRNGRRRPPRGSRRRLRTAGALAWWALIGLAAGCSDSGGPASRTPASASPASGARAYPAPRFPSYLRPPSSIEEVMPYVRPLVRARHGLQGAGLGIAEKGDTVLFVVSTDAEDLIVNAIVKAMEERGVTVIVRRDYEMAGVPRDEALAYRKARRSYTSEQGYMEAANWIEANFPDPDKAKGWLRQQRPDLYAKLFPPEREMTPRQREIYERMRGEQIGRRIREYLEQHPRIRGVFWGKGGSTSLRRYLRPLESKFLGLFLVDNRWDVMSRLGTYPGDVWQLAEDQSMEPIVHADRIEITDPEGTHVTAEISEEMARNWSRGVYQRGHLYMFPNQATGRFGYSVVDYPAFQGEWLPREPMALANGVIAGTTNHTGFFPRWEVTLKDGYVRDVKGGGLFGEALRAFLRYPNINDKVLPFHNANHPGYWWLYEIALGTHPKAFRNPAMLEQGSAIPERNRSGVFHWGLGVTLHHDPTGPAKSQKLLDFTAAYNLPRDHGWHTHTYFTTYRLHLRNADRWVTIVERGRLKSLDDPEVRALASRYGDPTELLEEDWRPGIPGLNEPGAYQDYARDPWRFVWGDIEKVTKGVYEYFFPPLNRRATTEASRPRAGSSAGGAHE